MKASDIPDILNLALSARQKGLVFNPMFRGEAGLGKSQVVQQWVEAQRAEDPTFGFLDLRIAYMEAPDLIGFPHKEKDENNLVRTYNALPSFWPTSGRGLLFLEEVNRGKTSVMNALMQLLTDRKIHNYTLPDGWIIAAAVNPDTSKYDVNAMDQALMDRFEIFDIEYDHESFSKYMAKSNWHYSIQYFINQALWVYKKPEELAEDAKYISPRTWSKLNAAELSGLSKNQKMHLNVCTSILGKHVGLAYHKFCFDDSPVTAFDLLSNKEKSIEKIKKFANNSSYRGDMISVLVQSIVENFGGEDATCPKDKIPESLMMEVAEIIPSDHAIHLIKECAFKNNKGVGYIEELSKKYKDILKKIRSDVKSSN